MLLRSACLSLLSLSLLALGACSSSSAPASPDTAAMSSAAMSVMMSSAMSMQSGMQQTTEPSSAAALHQTVIIQNFAFSPKTLTVSPGTTVTWMNNDSAPHTVTADSGGPASGRLDHGQSYSFTFTVPGTYGYHCAIHPMMTATVFVR